MQITYTQTIAGQRIDAALATLAPLDRMPELLVELRDATIRHARTSSTADHVAMLELRAEYIAITSEALGFNLDDELIWLAKEALSECGYDLRRMEYVDSAPVERFGMSHPDAGHGFRIGGAA